MALFIRNKWNIVNIMQLFELERFPLEKRSNVMCWALSVLKIWQVLDSGKSDRWPVVGVSHRPESRPGHQDSGGGGYLSCRAQSAVTTPVLQLVMQRPGQQDTECGVWRESDKRWCVRRSCLEGKQGCCQIIIYHGFDLYRSDSVSGWIILTMMRYL